jgi:hypothetical protein
LFQIRLGDATKQAVKRDLKMMQVFREILVELESQKKTAYKAVFFCREFALNFQQHVTTLL